MKQSRRSHQRGQAIIEFALTILAMALLALGAVNFGLVIQKSMLVLEASQEGALVASFNTFNSTQTTSVAAAAVSAGIGTSGMTVAVSSFCTCTPGGTAVSCTSSCSSDQPMLYVQTTATMGVSSLFPFSLLPRSWILASTTTMPVN